ncbi:uncharacterized protein LOC131299833 [Rhododendron vialii]|uniref:uncharacterized protein LOC131299833 n=1 Tax=Rhododendron vialii TaxID=182163 RepID=UPI00265F7AD0|nr:uncharacterized protein LOC131299833 [Rhododendron vialii]
MDKFLIKKPRTVQESTPIESFDDSNTQNSLKRSRIDLNNLPSDPGLRPKILSYHPNDRDDIRRAYLQKGPCQPIQHNFPQRDISGLLRRFNLAWFEEYKNWLEYNIEKDAAFCLCCYLFGLDGGNHKGGNAFIVEGFRLWNRKEKLREHVGGINSTHNRAVKGCEDLMKQPQHIQSVFEKHSTQEKRDYRTCLYAPVVVARFLLRRGQAFRGHDESEDLSDRENFLELLQFLADHNEDIKKVVLENTPKNHKLTHHDIQKDVVNMAACETSNAIIKEMGEAFFSILVDESRDISNKEQMALVLRYVNMKGIVIERFIAIVHVSSTTSLSLKEAIESLFARHGLSISRVRGQGYDGASNMRGEFNGLKALILRENEFAFYVHCFAHQLQLTLVAIAKKHEDVADFFLIVANIVIVVGGSCKRHDALQNAQVANLQKALDNGDLKSGRGLNQVTTLKRAGDTRWGSYYNTLLNLIVMFKSAIEVLGMIAADDPSTDHKAQARSIKKSMLSFKFAFSLHLVKNVMGITNELSIALQKKTQDIVNAMALVEMSKQRLQMMRDDGWDSLLAEVSSFCSNHNISFSNMSEMFVSSDRP